MCNSYNHSYDCTCGFGGYGHKGSSSGRGSGSSSGSLSSGNGWPQGPRVTYDFSSFESYINPNARCPVCRAPVFFYQSPHGGRVFFDELGPPWPKHPCTDNNHNSARVPASGGGAETLPGFRRVAGVPSDGVHASNHYAWQRYGWSPFLTEPVIHSSNWVRLNGVVATTGKRLVLYAHRSQITLFSAPMLVRLVTGRYVLSSFRYDHLGRFVPVEIETEDAPPSAKAWSEYGDLARLVLWFLSVPALPVKAFALRNKDRFGTRPYISDPPRHYAALNQIIELGPDKTTREQHRKLYEDLSGLYASFGSN